MTVHKLQVRDSCAMYVLRILGTYLENSGADAIALEASNVEAISFRGASKMSSNLNMLNRLTEVQ